MRATLFIIATLLSSLGMLWNIATIAIAGEEHKLAGAAYLGTSLYAWTAYFIMGLAWIRNGNTSRHWPFTGTLAALLAMNGGGSLFFSDNYHPGFMLASALYVAPAIIMATWLVVYHLRQDRLAAR